MKTTILLDAHLEDRAGYLQAGLREIGWEELVILEFVRLRDVGLANDCPDHLIWRFVQQHQMLLLTSNRNDEDETSLQATLERENTPASLPVVTIAHPERLKRVAFRQEALYALMDIIISPETYLGRGRIYIP
jgi:hypothetical protein